MKVKELYDKTKLNNPAIIVDCSHANANKQYMEQIRIAHDVMHSRTISPTLKTIVKGLMIESYLEDGSQPSIGDAYGVSITDPCLGFAKSEQLIYEIAEKV